MSDKNKYRVRLVRWGDSSSSGRTVTFKLPDDGDEHPFKGLDVGAKNGQLLEMEIAIYDGDGDVETLDSKKKPRATVKPRLPVVHDEPSGNGRRRATMEVVSRRVIPGAGPATGPGQTGGTGDDSSAAAEAAPSPGTSGSNGYGPGDGGGPEPERRSADTASGTGHGNSNLNGDDLDNYANQMGQAAEALAAVAERLEDQSEDDEPQFPTLPVDADSDADPGTKAVRRATDLCKAIDKQRAGFYYFMRSRYPQAPKLAPEDGEWSRDAKSTRDRVCLHCEAENLNSLAQDPEARRKFEELETEFERHERLR